MLVVIIIAAVVVIAAVVWVAIGRGGQLSAERGDYLPLDLGPVSATDVALLRPPTSLWGYNRQATDEAMERVAESIRERDVRIVALEQLVTDLSREHTPTVPLSSPYAGVTYSGGAYPGGASYPGGAYPGPRHRRTGEFPAYGTGGQPRYQTGEQPAYRQPDPEPEPFQAPEPEPYRRWEGQSESVAPVAPVAAVAPVAPATPPAPPAPAEDSSNGGVPPEETHD